LSDIISPCIKLCRLLNGVCIGCHRTKEEIREWFYGDEATKQKILDRINMKVKFVRASENAQLPTYGTKEAAGADVYSIEDYTIAVNESRLIDTGLNCVIPEGFELQVRPRSGLALKHGITVLNAPGTIDSDYTGKLGVILINHGKNTFKVAKGDRIAQIVLAPVTQATFEWAEETKSTERGASGFGSTGV
jgi:dUTP pyrophosphatase